MTAYLYITVSNELITKAGLIAWQEIKHNVAFLPHLIPFVPFYGSYKSFPHTQCLLKKSSDTVFILCNLISIDLFGLFGLLQENSMLSL